MYGYGELANGYSQLDRPLLSKHFQTLGWYCKEAEKRTQIGVNSLYTSTLLSTSVFSRNTFTTRANQTIRKHLEDTKTYLKNGIERVSMMYSGNLIANAFNADWMLEYGTTTDAYLLRGVPNLFENGSCNCVVSDSCQRSLRVGPPNLILPGLVVGCSPLNTLRLCTLECLFSSECIDAILNHLQYYTQANGSEPSNFTLTVIPPLNFSPLSASKLVRFSPTDLIGSLLDESFIDQSNQTMSYEKYFAACEPLNCYYSYEKGIDSLHIIISMLSLYGGLTISLRFIIWNTARIYYKVKARLRTQATSVEPFGVGNADH